MAMIQRLSLAAALAGALILPAVASADQNAPSQLCEGDKMKKEETTAEKGEAKRNADTEKSSKQQDDKSTAKSDKDANKS
jgi:hypothetical protein